MLAAHAVQLVGSVEHVTCLGSGLDGLTALLGAPTAVIFSVASSDCELGYTGWRGPVGSSACHRVYMHVGVQASGPALGLAALAAEPWWRANFQVPWHLHSPW